MRKLRPSRLNAATTTGPSDLGVVKSLRSCPQRSLIGASALNLFEASTLTYLGPWKNHVVFELSVNAASIEGQLGTPSSGPWVSMLRSPSSSAQSSPLEYF